MTIQFNINDEFAFRLTEHGQRLATGSHLMHPGDDGVYIEPLCFIMAAFGPVMHVGLEQFIENNLLWVPTQSDHINAKIALIKRTKGKQ